MDPLSVAGAAAERPDALALVGHGEALTYRELASRVRARAAELDPGALQVVTPRARIEDVVTLLAAVEAQVPLVLLHPRASEAERAERLALARRAPVPPGTLALLFTSGTTGSPKVAVLSRRAFTAAARASAQHLGWRPGDRWGLLLPPAHVGGLSVPLRCVQGRAAVVVGSERFDASGAIELVEREGVTLLSLVPTMLARMLDAGWSPGPAVRAVLIGGAPLPEGLRARAIERGVPLRATYGMTETCAQVATAEIPTEPGVGRPLPGVELRIVDGEIRVRGPSLFDGYLGEPPPFDADGFFPTGDAGRLDEAGRLHVLGRLDDRIITGGENVDPLEVERALEAQPAIDEACVFGLPDPEWGTRVVAFVVSAASDAELRAALADARGSLASHRRPRQVHRVSELPRSPSGKKLRRLASARAPHLVPLELVPLES